MYISRNEYAVRRSRVHNFDVRRNWYVLLHASDLDMYFDMPNSARKGDLSDFDMLLNEFDMLGEACQESKI